MWTCHEGKRIFQCTRYEGLRVFQCTRCTRENLVAYDFGWDKKGIPRKICIKCNSNGRLKYHCSDCHKEKLTASDFESDKQGERYKTCSNCRKNKKQYKANNRESINTKAREQYQLNKVKIKECSKTYRANNIDKLHRKIQCDCGGTYQYIAQAEHRRTKKHMKHMELLFDLFLGLGVWK